MNRRSFPWLVLAALCSTWLSACGIAGGGSSTTISCGSVSGNCSTSTSESSTTQTTGFPVTTTAWGASISVWMANHTADPSGNGNYWPRLSDGRDTYSQVVVENGIVVSFVYALYPSIPLNLAESLALSLLPSSLVARSTTRVGICTIVTYSRYDALRPVATFVTSSSNSVSSIVFQKSKNMNVGANC